jgi:hypothetical protein
LDFATSRNPLLEQVESLASNTQGNTYADWIEHLATLMLFRTAFDKSVDFLFQEIKAGDNSINVCVNLSFGHVFLSHLFTCFIQKNLQTLNLVNVVPQNQGNKAKDA